MIKLFKKYWNGRRRLKADAVVGAAAFVIDVLLANRHKLTNKPINYRLMTDFQLLFLSCAMILILIFSETRAHLLVAD